MKCAACDYKGDIERFLATKPDPMVDFSSIVYIRCPDCMCELEKDELGYWKAVRKLRTVTEHNVKMFQIIDRYFEEKCKKKSTEEKAGVLCHHCGSELVYWRALDYCKFYRMFERLVKCKTCGMIVGKKSIMMDSLEETDYDKLFEVLESED